MGGMLGYLFLVLIWFRFRLCSDCLILNSYIFRLHLKKNLPTSGVHAVHHILGGVNSGFGVHEKELVQEKVPEFANVVPIPNFVGGFPCSRIL